MCKPKKYLTTLLTEPITSAFGRTWSKHYALPIVHD